MTYRGSDIKRIKRFLQMIGFIDALIKTIDNTYIEMWR